MQKRGVVTVRLSPLLFLYPPVKKYKKKKGKIVLVEKEKEGGCSWRRDVTSTIIEGLSRGVTRFRKNNWEKTRKNIWMT